MYWISFIKWEKKVILNVIYRSPHGNSSLILQEIETLILEKDRHEADVVYLGDFNILLDDFRKVYAQNFLR